MFFSNLPRNVYLVFSVKLTIMTKETKLSRKQIRISLGFVYTKYKVEKATFKSATLDLQRKTIKRTVENHK